MPKNKTMEDEFNDKLLEKAKQEEVNQLQADVDYVAIMTGIML